MYGGTIDNEVDKELGTEITEETGDNIEEPKSGSFRLNFDFLKTETGPGDIEDYINHPLNYNKSESVAQILRGVTGFTDNLRLAVIDIAVGVFKMWRGKEGNVQTGQE